MVNISAAKLASFQYNGWTDKKATAITKIDIDYATIDGVCNISGIEMSIAQTYEITSGTSAASISGFTSDDVIIADFGSNTDSCLSCKITGGVFSYKDNYVYSLPSAVSLANVESIKIRIKGNGYLRFYDGSSKVITGGASWDSGAVGYSWGLVAQETTNITCADDGDYKIITIGSACFSKTQITKVEFFPESGNYTGYVDYIVAVAASTTEGE